MSALGLILVVAKLVSAAPPMGYPGAPSVPLGTLGGEEVSYFLTEDPIPKVARSFLDRWSEQGIPTTWVGDVRTVCAVSAFWTTKRLRTSVVLAVHRGRTLGLLVSRSMDGGPGGFGSPEEPSFPKGASEPGVVIEPEPVEVTRAAVRAQMLAAGFEEHPSRPSTALPDSWSAEFRLGDQHVYVFAAPLGVALTALVRLDKGGAP